ncbi:MAG: DUF559 domain-containing protein, partial [Parcubacteria group bacterium]|nr:DUF559 domain-containing protein [Parcubacteria group bacterium]
MPAPELILWQKIRGNSLGVKFRRQFSVLNHILDFYAPATKLAIEIDGESHFENPKAILNDRIRDEQLEELGIKVLRFNNREVMENLEGVLIKIQENLPPLSLPLS